MWRRIFCSLPCCERSQLAQVIIGDESVNLDDPGRKSAENSSRINSGGEIITDSTTKSNASAPTPGPNDAIFDVLKPASVGTDSSFIPSEGWKVGVRDIWGLGITIVIGGQYFSWNAGLSAGFGSYAIATGLIAIAYICLCCSVSELASAMPFAGGGYGLARVTLGFYAGFLIGCCEIIEYIVYVSSSVLTLGAMFITMTGMDPKFQPLIWIAFYVSAVSVYCYGGRLFWLVNLLLAFSSIIILVIYCLGSLKFADFRNAQFVAWDSLTTSLPTQTLINSQSSGKGWFVGGFSNFMYVFPLPAWFYVGIESINFACTDIYEPKRNIPRSSLTCIATLVVTSIAVLFISSSLPLTADASDPSSSLSRSSAPLNIGFRLMFNISDAVATALSLPATYATAFGFIFSYGRLMIAMSESRLLPRCFRKMHSLAYIAGSFISFFVCVLVYFVPVVNNFLFNITILSGFCAYTSQLYGFIMMRTRFQSIPRKFRSPLGIPGAVVGIAIFLMGIVAVIGFQKDNATALVTLVVIGAVSSVYYVLVAKKRQKFSKDELKVTFVAHVMKMEHLTNAERKIQIVDRMNLNKPGPRKKKKKKDGIPKGRRLSSMSLKDALHGAVLYISPSKMRRSDDDGDGASSDDEGDAHENYELENGHGNHVGKDDNVAGGGGSSKSGKDSAKKHSVPMLSLAGGGGVLQHHNHPVVLDLELPVIHSNDGKETTTQSQIHKLPLPEISQQQGHDSSQPSICWVTPDHGTKAIELVVESKEVSQEVVMVGTRQQIDPLLPAENKQNVHLGDANILG